MREAYFCLTVKQNQMSKFSTIPAIIRYMIEDILRENGFSEKQTAVYLSALELGEAPIGRLAERSHLKRTTVYSLLEEMKQNGLVSFSKRKGTLYVSALPPRVLVDRCKRAARLVEDALPELLSLAYAAPVKPRLRLYDGIDGVKKVLLEFGGSLAPTMGFTDYERMPREIFSFIRTSVVPLRRRTGIPVRFVVPRSTANESVQKHDAKNFGEHRLLDIDAAQTAVELLLFDVSKIAFLSFEGRDTFAAILDSPGLHKTLSGIFEFLWKIGEAQSKVQKE